MQEKLVQAKLFIKRQSEALESAQNEVVMAQQNLEDAINNKEFIRLKIESIKRKGKIEEIFWRFPHLGLDILEKLDNQHLTKVITEQERPLKDN